MAPGTWSTWPTWSRGRLAVAWLVAIAVSGGNAEPAARPSRTVRVSYHARVTDVPPGALVVRLWIPVPRSSPDQIVRELEVQATSTALVHDDPRHGNRMLFVESMGPWGAPVEAVWEARITRYPAAGRATLPGSGPRRDLEPARLAPIDHPRIAAVRDEALAGRPEGVAVPRVLYDFVSSSVSYDKSGDGWGRGDSLFVCDSRRGNCTDFHALFISLCQASRIPARFAIGLSLPPERGGGVLQGYHCWAYFQDGSRWVPVDASEARKDPTRRDRLFGSLDENRIELSQGRDLILSPRQDGEPLNFFVDPYVEIDSRPHAMVERRVTFMDVPLMPADRPDMANRIGN